jgi:hypothetical protein
MSPDGPMSEFEGDDVAGFYQVAVVVAMKSLASHKIFRFGQLVLETPLLLFTVVIART